MAPPVILDRLEGRIGGVRAVAGVSVTIESGELFVLLGPSGSGKTTTLRLIAGFIEPTRGRVLFGQRDVTRLPPAQRGAAMVFQSDALWPHLTVRGNVEFGLGSRRIRRADRRARAVAALRAVHMEGLADRKPAQLSGGQQQRAALARALAAEPGVLLLDEPLSNLDAPLRRTMRREIRRLSKQVGSTTIHVTHDRAEALRLADRLGVMRHGRLEQAGPPMEVYRRPVNRFVAESLGEANLLPATVVGRDNGRVLLDTGAGRLAATGHGAAVPASGRALVCVRPEGVRPVSGGRSTGINILQTTIIDIIHLGADTELRLQVGSAELGAADPVGPGMAAGPGSALTVSIDPDDVVILPDEP